MEDSTEQNYSDALYEQRVAQKNASKKKGVVQKKSSKKSVKFPLFLFLIALVKDTLDLIPFVGFLTTPLFWFIVFIWFITKDSASQEVLSLKMLLGGGASFAIGMIPIIKIIPETTIFVFSIYRSEKKALTKR